jgi:hypothetical protein
MAYWARLLPWMVDLWSARLFAGPCVRPADTTPFVCNNLPLPFLLYVIERTRLSISAGRLLGREPRARHGNTAMQRSGGKPHGNPRRRECVGDCVAKTWGRTHGERHSTRRLKLEQTVTTGRLQRFRPLFTGR